MFKLAIGAIVKDEAPYIEEWIAWHQAMGVEHFWIYDNESTDGTYEVLRYYESQGLVTLTRIPGVEKQYVAYEAIMRRTVGAAEWVALIDVDEFMLPKQGTTVLDHLPSDAAAVEARWAMFGTSGHVVHTSEPVTSRFTRRMESPHELCKSFIRPDAYVRPIESHHYVVDGRTHEAAFGDLRINHYWTKSEQECRQRFARGRVDIHKQRDWSEFTSTEDLYNQVEDTSAVGRIPSLRSSLVVD